MAATVLVMFTLPCLRSEERNANERGVVVHTCNPSRLETGTSSTSTVCSRPVCVKSGSRLAWMYQDAVLQQNSRNRGKSDSVVHSRNASASEAEAGRTGI